MKNTFAQRIVLSLLAIFLLAYVGFQTWRYFHSQYKTETVYSYAVSESARVSGAVLRREVLLDDFVGSGVATYLATDGTKLSSGSVIAEVYQSKSDAEITAKLRDLAHRREQLEKAQDPGTTSFAHTDVLNRQIFGELGTISDALNADGSLAGVAESADKLLVLMNTKQIATGKQTDYSGAIRRISAQEAYYAERIEESPKVITSPRQGYFIRSIDGMEELVDVDHLEELTPEAYAKNFSGDAKKPKTDYASKRVGKLMTDHNWYYAVLVTARDLPQYRLNAEVTLDFHIAGADPVPATVYRINEEEETGNAVVVFRSDYLSEALVNLRQAQADVNFRSVRGLRVSSEAIRFQGIQKGVYIVRGEKLIFRPIEVVYEDAGFVLCRETPVSDTAEYDLNLQQYDDVVIGGTQLYDNKPVK